MFCLSRVLGDRALEGAEALSVASKSNNGLKGSSIGEGGKEEALPKTVSTEFGVVNEAFPIPLPRLEKRSDIVKVL